MIIYKYELFLPAIPLHTFKLPKGAQIIHCAAHDNRIMFWAMVDKDEEELVARHFRVLGTGDSTDLFISPSSHIGTVFIDKLVLHIFEVQP